MINVTKPYLPNKEKLFSYINTIYENNWLTNNGPLTQQLEQRLTQYLGVKNLILVANGSLALQVAYRALELKGEVITTPFSFAATTSTLAWQNITPVFADIDDRTFNLCPDKVLQKITKETSAIVPVHVFGNPCDVERLDDIAAQHNVKIIYDAAHAFGVDYKGGSILNYGNISTLSFHATKLFHTIEGGAIITNDDQLAIKIRQLINFGLDESHQIEHVGINAKMNEFEAAMGLCVLDDIADIIERRAHCWDIYKQQLAGKVQFQELMPHSSHNYAYAPILFETTSQLDRVYKALNNHKINARRYFNPSLDELPYTQTQSPCRVSRDISRRILCLPIYPQLSQAEQLQITELILANLSTNR